MVYASITEPSGPKKQLTFETDFLYFFDDDPDKELRQFMVKRYDPTKETEIVARKRIKAGFEELLEAYLVDVQKAHRQEGYESVKAKRAVRGKDEFEHYRWLYMADVLNFPQIEVANQVNKNESEVSRILGELRNLIY
jgi:hypothetical protein